MGGLNLLSSKRERPPCNIPNTFAPLLENEFLNVNQVIMGLQLGLIQTKDLPDEVRAQFPKPRFNDDKSPVKIKYTENKKPHPENSSDEI